MKKPVLLPFFLLAFLVLAVGLACGLSVNTGGQTPQGSVPDTGGGSSSPLATITDSVPPAPAGPAAATALDYNLDPNFGQQSLAAGFSPDPFEKDITSGGSIDASYLGTGCNGFATAAPDFRLSWSGTSSRLRIMFVASGSDDTTLIINKPDGSWVCNDDFTSGNLDPMVEIASPSAGTYDIWVGSYSSGTFASGTLRITELSLTP